MHSGRLLTKSYFFRMEPVFMGAVIPELAECL